jgi:uncharacterized membrane protein YebE (DUF533 family)
MFKKKDWNKPFSEKVAKRVSKIPTGELTVWADQSLYEMGRLISSYERTRERVYLDELAQGAEAFHAVIHELNKRMTSTE